MSIDILAVLCSVVGDEGDVHLAYGGFEIRAVHPATFPWEKVFRFLLVLQYEVWIEKRDDVLVVMSKSPPI